MPQKKHAKSQEERDEDAENFERWYFTHIETEKDPFTPKPESEEDKERNRAPDE